MGDLFGLLFEFLLLAMGIYLYLYSIGSIKNKDQAAEKKAAEFRSKNGWLRYAAMALTAIALVNIVLHVRDLF